MHWATPLNTNIKRYKYKKALKDQLYQHSTEPNPFQFNNQVAEVFADMATRSIPGYAELLNSLPLLVQQYAQENSYCFDLGCSLASALIQVAQHVPKNCQLVGIDSSEDMINHAQKQLEAAQLNTLIQLRCEDLLYSSLEPASMIMCNYTMQFIPRHGREQLIRKIYESLVPNGVLLISEKTRSEHPLVDKKLQSLYCAFKRANGYDSLQISRKRQALEAVLVAETENQIIQRLHRVGFSVGVWQRHLQFTSLLAWKEA